MTDAIFDLFMNSFIDDIYIYIWHFFPGWSPPLLFPPPQPSRHGFIHCFFALSSGSFRSRVVVLQFNFCVRNEDLLYFIDFILKWLVYWRIAWTHAGVVLAGCLLTNAMNRACLDTNIAGLFSKLTKKWRKKHQTNFIKNYFSKKKTKNWQPNCSLPNKRHQWIISLFLCMFLIKRL